MKSLAGAMLCAVGVTTITACGGSADDSAAATGSSAAAASVTTEAVRPTPTTSPRGNRVKAIGEQSGIGRPGEPLAITWTVTQIAVDQPCTLPTALPATAGHFVALEIAAETTAGFESGALPGGFHPGNNWGIVDADGVTQPHADSDTSYRCHEATWPVQIAPGSKYRFRVTLDARTPHGTITFNPDGTSGWEWTF